MIEKFDKLEQDLEDFEKEIRGNPEFGGYVKPINDFLDSLKEMKAEYKGYLKKREREEKNKLEKAFADLEELNKEFNDYVRELENKLTHSEDAKECVGCIIYFTKVFETLLFALKDFNKLDYRSFLKNISNVRRVALHLKYDIFEHFMQFLPYQTNYNKECWRDVQMYIKDQILVDLEKWINLVMDNYDCSKLSESDLKLFESEKSWIRITKFHWS